MPFLIRAKLLMAVALCTACATTGCSQGVYKGHYFHNFETSSFTPEGSTEAWCVASDQMSKVTDAIGHSGSADVIVRGKLGPRGKYCNLGAYRYILDVEEVMSVSNIQSKD